MNSWPRSRPTRPPWTSSRSTRACCSSCWSPTAPPCRWERPSPSSARPGEDITAALAEAEKKKGGAAPKAAAPAAAAAPARPPQRRAPSRAGQAPAPAAGRPGPGGRRPRPRGRSARPAPAAQPPHPANGAGAKVLASPLARRLATDLGVDLRSVQGTGPGGRIVERDVKAAAGATGPRRRQPAAGPRRDMAQRWPSRLPAATAACPTRWSPSGGPRRGPASAHHQGGPAPPAVAHAQDHRPAAGRVQEPDPALLPDGRRRHGERHVLPPAGQGGPRGQAVGQRPDHQGGRPGPAPGARGQRLLHRGGDPPPRPGRHRHGGGHRGRPGDPGHPQRRRQDAGPDRHRLARAGRRGPATASSSPRR